MPRLPWVESHPRSLSWTETGCAIMLSMMQVSRYIHLPGITAQLNTVGEEVLSNDVSCLVIFQARRAR